MPYRFRYFVATLEAPAIRTQPALAALPVPGVVGIFRTMTLAASARLAGVTKRERNLRSIINHLSCFNAPEVQLRRGYIKIYLFSGMNIRPSLHSRPRRTAPHLFPRISICRRIEAQTEN